MHTEMISLDFCTSISLFQIYTMEMMTFELSITVSIEVYMNKFGNVNAQCLLLSLLHITLTLGSKSYLFPGGLHRLWKRFVYVHITILCIFSISSFLKWSLKKEKKEQFLLWSEDITTASCGLHKWTGTVHCREIDARETYKQQV